MDTTTLLAMLEVAAFRDREKLAAEAASQLPPAHLSHLVPHLGHKHPGVRLGVMEVLAAAGYRPALDPLLAHATSRAGDDRVFAIRALARLARPGDVPLRPHAETWSRSDDPFVQAQAQALLGALSPPVPAPPAAVPAGPASLPEDVATRLVEELVQARSDTTRMGLVAQMSRLPPPSLATSAGVALARGNADVVALVARAVERLASSFPLEARPELVRLAEAARARHGTSALVRAAVDACVMALQPAEALAPLTARLHQLDDDEVAVLAQRLAPLDAPTLALVVAPALGHLGKRPVAMGLLAPAVCRAAAHLRPSARADLKRAVAAALAHLASSPIPARPPMAPGITLVLAEVAEAGDPLPAALLDALESSQDAAAWRAATRLCACLGTEEAAHRLVSMTRDPLTAAQEAATLALSAFTGRNVEVSRGVGGAWEVRPRYHAVDGKVLVTADHRLAHPETGEEYVLDAHGQPVPVKATEHGGCRCCDRPRALRVQAGQGLQCPCTGERHLLEEGKPVLERNHPLGRCRACESLRPLVREGPRVLCPACRAEHTKGLGAYVVKPPSMAVVPGAAGGPVPHAPPDLPYTPVSDSDLPRPPARHDLQLVEPVIARAMAANVFLLATVQRGKWCGSGVMVARDGNDVAILTNRHILEDDDDRRTMASLVALTIDGETVPVKPVWISAHGADLALVEVTLRRPEAVQVMEVGHGACLVGSELFAIGNPMGLSWSYSSGTLSAFRDWKTQGGPEQRFLQTQVPIAPGSSGGGLYHRMGHLVGVISFSRVGPSHTGEANFAISVPTVAAVMDREMVSWRGRAIHHPT